MRDFIISQNIVTCPFGHLSDARNNVIDGVYNEYYSCGQDRKFIETIKIGVIILIPFAGLPECILAEIVSEPIYAVDTGLFTNVCDGKIQLSNENKNGSTHFRPVGRKIQIIKENVLLPDKRFLPRLTICRVKNFRVDQYI